MLSLPVLNVQSVDMSKVSAVSQQLSLVAEFQLKECAGEECIVQDLVSQLDAQTLLGLLSVKFNLGLCSIEMCAPYRAACVSCIVNLCSHSTI